MRIEIVEVAHRQVEARDKAQRTEISGLHDDHDRLVHQRPTAERQSQPVVDPQFPDRGHGIAAADRNAPAMLAGIHVDGNDATERRLEQRQSLRSLQIGRHADKSVGRLPRLRLANGNDERQANGADIKRAGFGIHRRPAPVAAAADAGHLDHAAVGRRRKQFAAIKGVGDLQRLLVNLRRQVDQVLVERTLDIERRRLGGKRLGRRRALARNAGGRHRALLDRPYRFPGHAVEHIGESLLRHLRDGLDALAVDGDVDQVRRGRRIVIPQAVMNELIVPDLAAGRDIETDQALAIEPVAGPVAAVIVVSRRAHRQIDVAELFVDAHRRPYIGVADLLPGFLLPGLRAGLLALRYGVEGPEQTAGGRIKPPDVAGR